MKLSSTRRALILANIFNSLVAIYFIIIAIVCLVQLRWYHQLTITVRVRHIITLTTSYFAFFILILEALLLLVLFATSTLKLSSKKTVTLDGSTSGNPDNPVAITEDGNIISVTTPSPQSTLATTENDTPRGTPSEQQQQQQQQQRLERSKDNLDTVNLHDDINPAAGTATKRDHSSALGNKRAIVLRDSSLSEESNASVCCSIILQLIATIGLIVILLIWLFNTGELVRDSISTQLDYAFARYQFTNRSNHYSIAIDGMQDINNCCGSLDFTDFPHQRISGLSNGHYPGSCCGKNIFGVNARVQCVADEIWRAKQTTGCTTVLANYYDMISLLVVPVALVSLFVNITIIALITISKRGNMSLGHQQLNHRDEALTRPNVGDNSYQKRANLRTARRRY